MTEQTLLQRVLRVVGSTAGALAGTALIATGCQSQPTEIEPPPGATSAVGGEETTVHMSGDVSLTVEGEAWTGALAVKEEVTPLRVEIRNGRQGDLLVRYESFRLTSDDGDVYAALPPWNIDERETVYVVEHDYDPIADPYYDHDDYYVAPYYADVYPGTDVYDTYDWDVAYYRDTYGYWADIELPTAEMLSRALPEGVIRTGGYVDGMIYFEHVPADEENVTLHAELRDPATGVIVATFDVPLIVDATPLS